MAAQKPARTELWLRKIHIPFVEDRTLTTLFRPERRLLSENHPKALGVGEEVHIRVLDKVGAPWASIYGTLLPEPNIPVIITSVTAKRLDEIAPEDFSGSTPDLQDVAALKLQLALIYNLSREELCPDFWVTRTAFHYL